MPVESSLKPVAAVVPPNRARSPRLRRTAQWIVVAAAGLLAWMLFMLGAVLQREYFVLLFPAGWCVYVAMRQFRQITTEMARKN